MVKRGRPPKVKEPAVDLTVTEEQEPVFAEPVAAAPDFDIATLGMREKTVYKIQPVKVSRPGFAEATEFKQVPVKEPDPQCDLNIEEARILVDNCGEQTWTFQEKKQRWICIATHPNAKGEDIRRRFMVTQEIHEQLGS